MLNPFGSDKSIKDEEDMKNKDNNNKEYIDLLSSPNNGNFSSFDQIISAVDALNKVIQGSTDTEESADKGNS